MRTHQVLTAKMKLLNYEINELHEKKLSGTAAQSETNRAENNDGDGGDLIAGKRTENWRRIAEKFVEETEAPVSYQVNVE